MALQSSGAISLNDIAGEFGGSTPHSLNEYYGVAAGIPGSGTISMNQFYGASSISLGDSYEGGYLICQSGGTRWIVAPANTEVARNWYERNDAITTANASSPCGDWFIPSCGQLKDPGYKCRAYWDSWTDQCYWSNTQRSSARAWGMFFSYNQVGNWRKRTRYGMCARAFRTVSY